VEKEKPENVGHFCNFQKSAQSGQTPKWPKIRPIWSPCREGKRGGKEKKRIFLKQQKGPKKTCNPKFRLEAQKNLSENATFQWHKKLPVVNSFQICSHPTHPPF
jgi:hypothetical protein